MTNHWLLNAKEDPRGQSQVLAQTPLPGGPPEVTSCLCVQTDPRHLGTAFRAHQQGQLLSTYGVSGVD